MCTETTQMLASYQLNGASDMIAQLIKSGKLPRMNIVKYVSKGVTTALHIEDESIRIDEHAELIRGELEKAKVEIWKNKIIVKY